MWSKVWKTTSAGIAAVFIALAPLATPGCHTKDHDPITIAVAANLQYAVDTLVHTFERQHNIACEMVIGSSGKLTAQIMQGAPVDVFLSADMQYPEALAEGGFTEGKPMVYAYGQLVLWTMNDTFDPNPDVLLNDHIRHIAMANPKTAPYGTAALSALRHYGLLDSVRDKLVFGESIAQTNQFILTGAAEIGFTAKSVVLSQQVKGKGAWIAVEPSAYTPIAQGIVIIGGRRKKVQQATKFRDFLLSDPGKQMLRDSGYSTE
jgi:molybdate transport system substrate-binding protein